MPWIVNSIYPFILPNNNTDLAGKTFSSFWSSPHQRIAGMQTPRARFSATLYTNPWNVFLPLLLHQSVDTTFWNMFFCVFQNQKCVWNVYYRFWIFQHNSLNQGNGGGAVKNTEFDVDIWQNSSWYMVSCNLKIKVLLKGRVSKFQKYAIWMPFLLFNHWWRWDERR